MLKTVGTGSNRSKGQQGSPQQSAGHDLQGIEFP